MLYGAGINIYAGTVQGLSREDCIYIPSLTIRSEMKSKVLAGTVFYGILRIGDTAYVLYYTDDIADGAFPEYDFTYRKYKKCGDNNRGGNCGGTYRVSYAGEKA